MIVTKFDLPPDEVDSFEPQPGDHIKESCVRCHKRDQRARRLCDYCYDTIHNRGELHLYPAKRQLMGWVYDEYLKLKAKDGCLTYQDVAARLNLTERQVSNAVRRARRKRGVQREQGRQYRDWVRPD